MWKLLFTLIAVTPAYSQVFTEDLARINYFIGQEEIHQFAQKPAPEGLPGDYLKSLVIHNYLDPLTNCDGPSSGFSYPADKTRYEVLMISEDPQLQETTVVLAKMPFQEEEHQVVLEVKKLISEQQDHPGIIEKKFAEEKSKDIIHYVKPNTVLKVTTEITGENAIAVDFSKKLEEKPTLHSSVKVDVMNRMDLQQALTDHAQLQVSLESNHSSGPTELEALEDMRFQLRNVKARARLDHSLTPQIKSYSEVRFNGDSQAQNTQLLAGLSIRASSGAEILVFTGHGSQREGKEETQLGIEYKARNGVKVFGRIQDSSEKGPSYETGIEVKLGK